MSGRNGPAGSRCAVLSLRLLLFLGVRFSPKPQKRFAARHGGFQVSRFYVILIHVLSNFIFRPFWFPGMAGMECGMGSIYNWLISVITMRPV